MKARPISLIAVGLSCLVTFASSRVDAAGAATITMTNPAAGQAFGVNAPIGYSGRVTWPAGNPDLERVQIDYIWTNDQARPPGPGQGVIVDSQDAERFITMNPPGTAGLGGTANYDNPPVNQIAALKALQYTMPNPPGGGVQATTYWLRATPYSVRGGVYFNGPNTVNVITKLGAVQ